MGWDKGMCSARLGTPGSPFLTCCPWCPLRNLQTSHAGMAQAPHSLPARRGTTGVYRLVYLQIY